VIPIDASFVKVTVSVAFGPTTSGEVRVCAPVVAAYAQITVELLAVHEELTELSALLVYPVP